MDFQKLFGKSPTLLSQLFEILDQQVALFDHEGTVLSWSPLAEKITGFSSFEATKSDFLQTHGHLADGYLHLIKRDGTLIRVRAFPLSKEGKECCQVVFFKPVKEGRQEWCSDLFKQTMLYTAILQSMKEGVITIDEEFLITSFSKRSELITGYTSDQVMGRPCHEIIGSHLCHTNCPAKKALKTRTHTDTLLADVSCASGKPCHISETAVPLESDSGELMGTLLFIEDRSEQIMMHGNPNDFMGIIGRSASMGRIFQILRQVSPTDVTVLITGESGTGKEMIARALHRLSPRKHKHFQAINCAALPLPLLESELFGHVKGAFTGATRDRAGNIETAEGGTLFLDEIGELPMETQSKLLRFLQEYEYQRVGDSKIRKADVRIIAATNRNLRQEIAEGNFREDLYYRIRVIPIEIPPLRERAEDILLLAVSLLGSLGEKRGRPNLKFSQEAMELLMAYQWPGNVRELINTIEYTLAMAPNTTIQTSDLPRELRETADGYPALRLPQARMDTFKEETERDQILRVLQETDGNKAKAARLLNMHRVTLYRKLKRYGLA